VSCVLLWFADIDECAEGKHYCRENTMCMNTPGSFMCVCHTGYVRIDDYSCTGEYREHFVCVCVFCQGYIIDYWRECRLHQNSIMA